VGVFKQNGGTAVIVRPAAAASGTLQLCMVQENRQKVYLQLKNVKDALYFKQSFKF